MSYGLLNSFIRAFMPDWSSLAQQEGDLHDHTHIVIKTTVCKPQCSWMLRKPIEGKTEGKTDLPYLPLRGGSLLGKQAKCPRERK